MSFSNEEGLRDAAPPLPPILFKAAFVDDDGVLLDLTRQYCRLHGIEVVAAADGQALDRILAGNGIELVLLDIGLAGEDGLSICRRLRASNVDLPLILVSGRAEEIDRILGLEIGADDYITKPFVPRELVARMKALHRRSKTAPAEPARDGDGANLLRFGPYVFDMKRRELQFGDKPVQLTNAEIDLLTVFCRHPGVSLSRVAIQAALEESGFDASERAIDVTVARLRKMVEQDPKAPSYIKTVWGSGYMFTP